jgi:hypothetical protein
MPLGSAPTSKIDIDFTRAQGLPSSGQIIFRPTRLNIGTTMISTDPVVVDVVNGVGSVNLVRLPFGTYKVREIIDGTSPYEFSFALPLSAPDTIRYETIAPAVAILPYSTVPRSVNGQKPDPITGDIEIVFDGGLGELGGFYTKPADGIPALDMSNLVRENLLKAAYAVQPDVLAAAIEDVVGLMVARSLPDRILEVVDRSRESGDARTYNMLNTDGAWTSFIDGPPDFSIEAAIGDHLSVSYNYLIAGATTSFVDLQVIAGAMPVRKRYLSSKSYTPTFSGSPGNYQTDAALQGRSGTLGFYVGEDDIDNGFVRFRWVIKTSNTNGKMYANVNYPLIYSVRNTRLSGI